MTEFKDWSDKRIWKAAFEREQLVAAPRFLDNLGAVRCPDEVPDPKLLPFCAVGTVVYSKPDGSENKATAFAIGGNFIMTAAHCVCKAGSSNLNSNYAFFPAATMKHKKATEKPFGRWKQKAGRKPHLMPEWEHKTSGDPWSYDLAIIELESLKGKTLEQVVGAFRLAYDKAWKPSDTNSFTLDAIGYPRARSTCPNLVSGRMQIQHGSYHSLTGNRLARNGQMGEGSSGGPWVNRAKVSGSKFPKVYGLTSCSNKHGINYSPYFSQHVKKFVEQIVK